MAARRFGALNLVSTNTETVLMSGAAGWDSTVNVRFTNRNATSVKVRLALVDQPSGTALPVNLEDWLEYDAEILPNEVLEETGLAVPEDHTLVVSTDTAGVSVVAYGWEEQKV